MTTLTVGVDFWTNAGLTPTDGLLNFQIVNPILDGTTGRVTASQVWSLRLGADGTGSNVLPSVPVGNALKVTSLVEGFEGVWYVTVPNVATVTLVDLLTNYQVDPVNLAPLPSAPPVAVAIAAAQAAAIAASEPVGLSSATRATLATVLSSNGTDQTASINAALAASVASGATRIVRLVGSFVISAPLVIPSHTYLDATGAYIALAAASNCNMIQNAAVGAVVRVLDAAMTSGSGVLTSASGLFAAGMVGQAITVQGAGPATGAGLPAPLTTTVASYQSATQVTLAATASATVSGQYAAVGARDRNITVIGGKWDRAGNNSSPANSVNAHNFRFRHVDGLMVRSTRHASTGGKYGVNAGDVTRVRVEDTTFPAGEWSSDGVHFNGPASQIVVKNTLSGSQHDDLVSFTARDTTSVITDCAGDITDVVVDTALYATSITGGFASALKIVAGKTTDGSAPYAVRRLSARNLTGPTVTAPVVFIGDPSGGSLDDIDIDGVRSLGGGGGGCVIIHGGDTIGSIRARNLTLDALDSWGVNTDVSVARLHVSNVQVTASSGAPNAVKVATGTVTEVIIDGCQGTAPGGALLFVAAGGVVTQAVLSGNSVQGGFRALQNVTGATLTTASVIGLDASGSAYPLGILFTTTGLSVSGLQATGVTANAWVQGSGLLTIAGWEGIQSSNDTILGAYTIAPKSALAQLAADPDRLTSGDESIPRLMSQATPQLTSGTLVLTYFTARRSETITKIKTVVAGTAAAGTTLARMGLYTVAASGDLTLVASTTNDLALWGSTFATVTEALSASYSKVAGQRYALGVLFTGTTGPKLSGHTAASGNVLADSPRMTAQVTAQTDLPATLTGGSLGTSGGVGIYASLLP